MAFKNLREFRPNLTNLDPRVSSSHAVNSSLCVVSLTHYKTYNDLLQDKKTVMDTKMLGILNNFSQSEVVHISDLYDIGNKTPIPVSGKMSGSISLDSGIIESINLLGTIYETILVGLQKKYENFGYSVKLAEEVMFTPSINPIYNSDPVDAPEQFNGTDVMAQAATPQEDVQDPTKGAIMLTLDDLRLRVKFGMCLTLFQDAKRLGDKNAFSVRGVNGSILESEFDQFDKFSAFNKPYQMIAGVFLENCMIYSQSRSLSSTPEGSGIFESVNIRYTSAKNVRPNLFLSEASVPVPAL